MDRSRKRTKMMMDSDAISSKPSPRCYFTTLPLELIAEILSYTPSPRDILAVARTCKHFCAVLVNNPASEFIWRHSRARFIYGPIPDFSPNFTEASYAAFLFDTKICEVGQSTVSLGGCRRTEMLLAGMQVEGKVRTTFGRSSPCSVFQRESPGLFQLF